MLITSGKARFVTRSHGTGYRSLHEAGAGWDDEVAHVARNGQQWGVYIAQPDGSIPPLHARRRLLRDALQVAADTVTKDWEAKS